MANSERDSNGITFSSFPYSLFATSLIRDGELAARRRWEGARYATAGELELEHFGIVVAAHISMSATGREAHAHGRLLGRERSDLLHAVGEIDRGMSILVRRHHHIAIVGRDPHAPHLPLGAVGARDRHRAPERMRARIDHVELGRALRGAIERGAIRRD